jgi:hypothetical protein
MSSGYQARARYTTRGQGKWARTWYCEHAWPGAWTELMLG